MVFKFDEKPKDFPKNTRRNMILEISIPENHHGHGFIMKSFI